jgi:hypothetical protein
MTDEEMAQAIEDAATKYNSLVRIAAEARLLVEARIIVHEGDNTRYPFLDVRFISKIIR